MLLFHWNRVDGPARLARDTFAREAGHAPFALLAEDDAHPLGTSLASRSRLWFLFSHGLLDTLGETNRKASRDRLGVDLQRTLEY